MRGRVGRGRRSGAGRAATLAVLLAITLAGCSSGGDGSSSDSAASGASGGSLDKQELGSADAPRAADSLTDSTSEGDSGAPAGRTGVQTRAVISTGEVQLESGDLSEVRTEIDRLLGRYGGFIAKEQTHNEDDGTTSSSTLEIRVPSQHFEDVMSAFADFSTVVDASRKAEDVTTEVIDVDSRIKTQEVSLERLRGFLGRATDVNDVIRLESEIASREADLASLRSQQNYLADQTSLASITVHMALPPEQVVKNDDDPLADAGFLTGLRNGWNALTDLAVVAATVVGALLPFAIVLALVLVPLMMWLRTSRRRRATVAPPVAPPPAAS